MNVLSEYSSDSRVRATLYSIKQSSGRIVDNARLCLETRLELYPRRYYSYAEPPGRSVDTVYNESSR